MRTGALTHRVTIEVPIEVSDGHDGLTAPKWVPVQLRIPAAVRPLQGRDLERARQIEPRTSHEVTTRFWRTYRHDTRGGRCRVVYHGHDLADRILEVVAPAVDVDERHQEVRMLCREAA